MWRRRWLNLREVAGEWHVSGRWDRWRKRKRRRRVWEWKVQAGRKLAIRRGTNSVRKTGKGSVSVSDSEPRIFRNFYKMSSASVWLFISGFVGPWWFCRAWPVMGEGLKSLFEAAKLSWRLVTRQSWRGRRRLSAAANDCRHDDVLKRLVSSAAHKYSEHIHI